jgi:hypothetical protein
MDEAEFTRKLVEYLRKFLKDVEIETEKTLFYSLYVDESGNIPLHINNQGEPVRGGGTGFEQDILIFEHVEGKTSIVPRVIVEAKFRGVTTHDTMVYSGKAERIRNVYPYIRYGMMLEDFQNIPARVLRLGLGFDFIISINNPPAQAELENLKELLKEEIGFSRQLGKLFIESKSATIFRRKLSIEPSFTLELPVRKVTQNPSALPQPTKKETLSKVTFYVYENWQAENKAKIHYGHCPYCNYGKGIHADAGTRNGRWHGPFDDFQTALQAAKTTGRDVSTCKFCSPG